MKKELLCRGDGKIYIKVKTKKPIGTSDAVATLLLPGRTLVVGCYPFCPISADVADCWILEIPIMDVSGAKVQLCGTSEQDVYSATLSINFEAAKWESRFNYRIHKKECFEIRDYERTFLDGQYQPRILQYLEGEDSVIWRIEVRWFGLSDPKPSITVHDGRGELLSCKIYPFELFVADKGNEIPNSYTFSLELPTDCRYFFLQATDCREDALPGVSDRGDGLREGVRECFGGNPSVNSGGIKSGFCSVNPGAFEAFKHESWKYMKDARADDAAYQEWFEKNRVTIDEWQRQKKAHFDIEPLVSIVVPCYQSNEVYLKEMVDSVLAQSYSKWELLLMDASAEVDTVKKVAQEASDVRVLYKALSENEGIVGNTNKGIAEAKGDYVAFLDHDDLLEPNALYCYVKQINEDPATRLLFCDEDLFSEKGAYTQPVFKTSLNVDLLYSHNCITHFLAIESAYLREIGLSNEAVSGAQDYDLVLRALENGGAIKHVPHVLYHWREHEGSTSGDNKDSKPYAEEAGRLALQGHFDRQGIKGKVEVTEHPYVYRMRYALPDPLPLVSVVIPNKDHIDVLDECVMSLLDVATYENMEILIVENNSEDQATFDYYRELEGRSEKIRVIQWEREFNYSQIVNFGVARSRGEYVLLLNNDTKVIMPDFLEEMLGYLMRKDAGVVGPKLYFRDGLVQHAGMIVGPYGAVAHVNQNYSRSREGYLARAVRPGNFSAVTGACQLVKKTVFEEVGGYEESLAVGFNDVDFCLKVWRAGYRVIFTPYAELYHYEFTSRGRETFDKKKMYRWKQEQAEFTKRWPEYFLEGDPFVNPNLGRDNFYFDLP